jgi:hypothetical protein
MNRVVNTTADGVVMQSSADVTSRGWHHRVSLSAVIIGALVAVTVGVTLTAMGAAIGTGLVDAVERDTPSASTFTMGAGAWMVLTNLVGLFTGGIVAGRLSGAWSKEDGALHGLGVWAIATLFALMLLGGVVGRVGEAVGNVAGGAASSITQAAGAAAPQVTVNPREIADRARAALSAPADPARMNGDQRAAEIARLVGNRITQGNLNDADRQRLNVLIAAEAGLSPEEADRRVRAYEADAQRVAQETEQRARVAATATAKAASLSGWFFFATLLLGALAAYFGAGRGAERATAAH